MHRGYIKLWRKIEEWDWFKNSNTLQLFIYLLIRANHKNGSWQGIEIMRGQLLTGRKSLSEKTGLSDREIRTSLSRLKLTKEITVKSTNKFSIITLCNYDIYNDSDQQDDQQPTSNRPATDQQPTTNKNYKNDKNDKKHKYGEYKHVLLSDEQYQKLLNDFGELKLKGMIKNLDEYLQMKNVTYKDHNLTMRKWENKNKSDTTNKPGFQKRAEGKYDDL
jgi:hypothetical protein